MPKIAAVVGGADTAWNEIELARGLCRDIGAEPEFFFINDMIAQFPDKGRAVSLHPDKIPGWIHLRRRNQLPEPIEISHHEAKGGFVTHTQIGWGGGESGGSSGLFSVKLALDLGFDRILLCGVPMSQHVNHFARGTPWRSARAFQKGWNNHLAEIRPYVRSFSGWTAEKLGTPDASWFQQN